MYHLNPNERLAPAKISPYQWEVKQHHNEIGASDGFRCPSEAPIW